MLLVLESGAALGDCACTSRWLIHWESFSYLFLGLEAGPPSFHLGSDIKTQKIFYLGHNFIDTWNRPSQYSLFSSTCLRLPSQLKS